jgi:hypothetical protein
LTASSSYNQTNNLRINITAGTDIVNLQPTTGNSAFGFVNFTGFSGTYTNGGLGSSYFTGVTFSPTMSFTYVSTTSYVMYSTGTMTTNGKTLVQAVQFGSTTSGVTANTTLGDALTCNLGLQFGSNNSTFSTNNYSVATSSDFTTNGLAGATVNFGSSTVTVGGNFTLTSDTTMNAGTSTISMTSASAKTFAGAGKTFYNVVQAGAGQLNITGSNTFNSLTNTTQPATVQFEAGSTNTFTTFGLSGTAGNLVTIQSSSTGTRYTLSDAAGLVAPTYLSIKDSAATGGAYWAGYGQGVVNAGNNTGWNFAGGSFIPMI